MNPYAKYTPLRITVPFISGIVSQLNTVTGLSAAMSFMIVGLCFMSLLFAYYFLRMNYRFRWVSGFLSFLSLFFLGYTLVSLVEENHSPVLNGKKIITGTEENVYLCRMAENPLAKTSYAAANATVISILDIEGNWKQRSTKIRLYFKFDSLCTSLGYGDLIMISCHLQEIPEPANPDVFDYRQYLSNRQIYFQGFLDQNQWRHVGRARSNPLRSGAAYCRDKILDILRAFHIDSTDFALSSALLIGVKDYLDNETRQEFSHAGAMHVLCVSGLHVGILFVVADKMLFLLKRTRRSRKFQQIIIIIFIWFYAFITGLSPSVTRAALMFSLIAAGRMFKRNPESYNILAVAAFIQLLFDPFAITQLGFQLSYLAVLGIFAFYKPFNSMINTPIKLLGWIWSILAVSMAAQLATFPLACYYFNLFPAYFLLTNLIVVPLAALIIYLAMTLILSGMAGLTGVWLAWPFIWSLRFMSGSVKWIQLLPGAVIEPVVFSMGEVILIYVSIIALFAYFVLLKRKWVLVMMGAVLVLIITSAGKKYLRFGNSEIVVYQVSGHTAIDLIHNRNVYFICDSSLVNNDSKIDFMIHPHRLQMGVRQVENFSISYNAEFLSRNLYYNYPFILFHGKRFIIVDENWKNDVNVDCYHADMIILKGTPNIIANELKSHFCTKYVVIDSSVPAYLADKFLNLYRDEGIPCSSVRHSGAFVSIW